MASDLLFLTRNDIVTFTSTNGNLDPDRFMVYIKIAQDRQLQPLLGTKLFDKLKDDIRNNVLIEPYLSLLEDKLKPIVMYYTMVEFLPFANYQIANKGVFTFTQENGQIVPKDEVDQLIEKNRSIAEFYAQRFIDYICFNQNLFPEYNQNQDDQIYPTTNNYWGGWVM